MSKNEGIKAVASILATIAIAKKLTSSESASVYERGAGRPIYTKEQEERIEAFIGDHWSQSFEELKAKVAGWVPRLDPNKFYITSTLPITAFYNMEVVDPNSSAKPSFRSTSRPDMNESRAAMWFAPGSAWIDWMITEMPHWMYGINYLYEIELNPNNIAIVDNDFLRKYVKPDSMGAWFSPKVLWEQVAQRYSGAYDPTGSKIYGWDLPSGCVWNWDGVKSITLVAQKPGSSPAPKVVGFGGSFNILDNKSVMQKAPLTKQGYKKALRKYKKGGEGALGYTERSSLKALGLIPRADGTYKVSKKYQGSKARTSSFDQIFKRRLGNQAQTFKIYFKAKYKPFHSDYRGDVYIKRDWRGSMGEYSKHIQDFLTNFDEHCGLEESRTDELYGSFLMWGGHKKVGWMGYDSPMIRKDLPGLEKYYVQTKTSSLHITNMESDISSADLDAAGYDDEEILEQIDELLNRMYTVEGYLECKLNTETMKFDLEDWSSYLYDILVQDYRLWFYGSYYEDRNKLSFEDFEILKVEPNIFNQNKSKLRKR